MFLDVLEQYTTTENVSGRHAVYHVLKYRITFGREGYPRRDIRRVDVVFVGELKDGRNGNVLDTFPFQLFININQIGKVGQHHSHTYAVSPTIAT